MPGICVEPPKAFAHRPAKDNRYDSICHTCFRVVASANREKELARLERKHECSPYDLAFLPKFGPH
ncbi:MAG TPA: hypothetical protein VHW46_04390 [Terracidiphilus sp.]|jgi:hypothetical protein|nr:hypothetical protein [Terracidiphilus sp.]